MTNDLENKQNFERALNGNQSILTKIVAAFGYAPYAQGRQNNGKWPEPSGEHGQARKRRGKISNFLNRSQESYSDRGSLALGLIVVMWVSLKIRIEVPNFQ